MSRNFGTVYPPPYGSQVVNYQGDLINVIGTNGPFRMPQQQPPPSSLLLTLTGILGIPTSTPPGGSLAYDTIGNTAYIFVTGIGWTPLTGAGAVETWAQTLAAGNTSGPIDPILSAGRTLIFADNICIGGSNLPLTSTTAAILIGDSITPGGLQCVQIGKGVVATGAGCTLIGSSSTGTGASVTALGYGAQGLGAQATALGYNAQCGINATAVGVNSVANGAQSSAFGYNATAVAFTNATALGTGATCTANSQIMMGTSAQNVIIPGKIGFVTAVVIGGNNVIPSGVATTSVVIGNTGTASGTNVVCIGTGANTKTANNGIAIGLNATFDATATDGIAVGNSSYVQGVDGVAIGHGANTTTLTNATAVGSASLADGAGASAYGYGAQAGPNSTALGNFSNCLLFSRSTALGYTATCTANDQIRAGVATTTVSVPGALVMPSALAVGETFKFLTLSGVAGTPTGAALEGSLAMDTTNHLAYLRTNSAWVQIQTGAGATPSWSSVLAAGNSTGANNPTVASGQSIIFTSGVAIGSAAVAPSTGTPAVNTVLIGGGTVGSGGNCVVIGRNATSSTFAFANAIGAAATVTGAGGVALGYNATCAAECVAIGDLANTNTSTNCICIGSNAISAIGCNNSIQIGSSTTATSSVTGAICIGYQSGADGTDSISIGRATSARGTSSIAIGAAISQSNTNSNCVLVGAGIGNSQAGSTGNVGIGQGITFTAGSAITDCIALGRAVTVPSGSNKTFYLPPNMTTAAASTAVNYNTVTGQIYPVTSARKFKQNIRDLEGVDRILNAVPRKYNMAKGHCHCPPVDGCDGTCCEEVGVIADEMEAAGLSDFVVYGDHDRKEAVGVLYDRMVVPLIAVVKSQQERLDILEEQLAKLLSSKP